MTINEEMHRLVLRGRWVKWVNRTNAVRRMGPFRLVVLSERLSRWRPVWDQRGER